MKKIEFENGYYLFKLGDILKKNKINVTVRREFGSEVSAACGQLRASQEEK